GGGDLLLGSTVAIFNWLSLQVVMMVFVLPIFLLEQLARAMLELGSQSFSHFSSLLVSPEVEITSTRFIPPIWWSPLFPWAAAILVFSALPLGAAYWIIPEPGTGNIGFGKRGPTWPPFAVLFLVATVASAYLCLSWLKPEIGSYQSQNFAIGRLIAGSAIT